MSVSNWFVVKVKPHKERVALINLRRQDFKTLAPRMPTTPKSKIRNKEEPLFPGYIFVQVNLEIQSLTSVNSTIGVQYVVNFNNRPSPVLTEIIETIVKQTDKSGFFYSREKLLPGTNVRVLGGPLDGFIGIVAKLDKNERSTVLLNIMNGNIKTNLHNKNIIKIE